LIERHPESLRIEDVSHHLPVPAQGLTSTGQHEYHPIMSRALRLYPHLCGTSGFFSTLIRKTATLGQPTLMPPQRSLRSVGFRPFSKREEKELVAVLLDRYGFKLESLLEDQGLALWRRNKSVYAFPEAFMSRFADLPCQSLGLEIGEWTPHFFVVSHEWATRFHARFHQGCCTLADESVPKWMRGEDVPLQGCRDPVGSMVVVMDESGQPLGRGKVLPQRLKNMLPRRIVVD
jgi:16S rRNA (cytosine1407-C5)-methyltransferase